MKKGDHKTVNLILTERFLKSINNGQGYDKIQPQKISNITIKLDDTDYGEPLGEKINNDQEANYILQFNIDESTESYFYAQGGGQYYLFVKLLNENNIWKIDVISTSP